MKVALGYIVSAIIAAGVVEMIGSQSKQAAIMLAFVTLLLVVIANQEKVKLLFMGAEGTGKWLIGSSKEPSH